MRERLKALSAQIPGFFHSVRFRLAVWFAVILAIVLLVFSLSVYYRTTKDVRNYTAAQLVSRLRELNQKVQYSIRGSTNWDRWHPPDSADEPLFVLKDNEALIISDLNGEVLGLWGAIDANQAAQVAALCAEDNGGGFVSFKMPQAGSGDTRPVEYLFNPSPIVYNGHTLGQIMIGLPVDPDRNLPRLVLTLALAGTLTLLVAMTGSYWLASRALWPVKAITRTAQEISETDLSQRLNLRTNDELGELATTFDNMLDRLQAAFTRQRQFTADASHELRTPLSIINLETSRALAGRRSPEDYRRALEVVQSENEFMTHLVEELLTLARLDAGHTTLKHETLDLSDLALDVVERYAPLAAQKHIQLLTGSLPELLVQGDRQYLLQMIGNLVENAIKYSPASAGQWVRVETGLSQHSAKQTAWVRVTDNGPGIAAQHLPHLFDRFYRVDPARSHNLHEDEQGVEIPGSGLGLSIVQWVARAHQGTVTVQSQPGQGSTFEVQIPAGSPAV